MNEHTAEYNSENTAEDLRERFDYYLSISNFFQANKVIMAANSLEMFDLAADMSRELEEVRASV